MTATPIPGYTVDKVRNALRSTGGVSQLFFVCGSVVKIYLLTENLCVSYIGATCVVYSSFIVRREVVSVSALASVSSER
jgi:hypothetical protein